MRLSLSASGIALSLLGVNLKSGILYGTTGISSTVGVIVAAANRNEIVRKITDVSAPAASFFVSNISPQLNVVKEGALKIKGIFSGWTADIITSNIGEWIKTQEFKNIFKGFSSLISTFGSWIDTLKGITSSVWNNKDSFLNKEIIVKILTQASDFSSAIKTALSTFAGALFMAMQHSLSPSSQAVDEESQNAANSLKSLFSSGKFIDFLKSAWSVVSENPEAIKKINGNQVKQLLSYATKNVDSFVKRVEFLKSSSSKWGKYKTSAELINAILNNSWGNITVSVLNLLFSPFSSCGEDKENECDEDNVFVDTVKALEDIFKNGNEQEK